MNRQTVRPGLILFVICLCAGLLLGVAHTLTEGAIETKKASVNEEAYREVLPQASALTKLELDYDQSEFGSIQEIYEAPEGYAVKVIGKGYAGDDIEIAVGIDKEGKVTGLSIISMSETPGLGAKAKEPAFCDQFIGKSTRTPLKVVKTGNAGESEIDALTGATKTSNGVTKAVNTVFSFYETYLKGRK